MEKILTAVSIGLGSRGNVYASQLKKQSDKVKLVACADINPEKLNTFADTYGIPGNMRFSSAEELLAAPLLADIAIIATPDRYHAGQAIAAMKKGYNLLLEKPVSPVLSDCLEVARIANELDRRVIVGHVLRYTAFYGIIKDIVSSGEIGQPISVEAFESVMYWHQAHSFVRGNWRNKEESSPMILQKSCHDMDILLWLTGKHCKSVSSFGSLSHFKAECAPAGAPDRCTADCPAYETCPYSVEKCYLSKARKNNFGWPVDVVTQKYTLEDLELQLKNGPYGRCVYHCDNNVVDHQVVNLLLDDDVTVSFTMCAFTGKNGRMIRFMGTKGEIIGDMENKTITVYRFGGETRVIDARPQNADNLGHGGGDYGIVRDMLALYFDEDGTKTALTGISDSVESHIVALAAEESRINGGKLIDIKEFCKITEK